MTGRFPFPPGPLGGEPREYTERRASCPFSKVTLRTGHEATLVLSYQDAVAALADERFSRVLAEGDRSRWFRGTNVFTDPVSLVNQEGPEHLRQRKVITSALTATRIGSWTTLIQDTVTELLDEVVAAGPGTDLMTGFFTPFPMRIICTLLGVPLADYERFRGWSNSFISAVPRTQEQRAAEMAGFLAYARELIARKRAEPADDISTTLISAQEDGRLSEDEVVYILIALIATGAYPATNVLSRITLMLLLDDRREWEQIARQGGFTRTVVNELLRRVQQGNGAMIRVAREDIDLPSGTIPAGETVLLPLSSENLDEAVFPDARALRFDREGPRSLIFSAGSHYCPGVNLAKAEVELGLQALMSRLPGLRLAIEPGRLRFSRGELITMIRTMPVTW